MESRNGKILSIQALRAFAFLGIFLSHAGARILKWPQLGVSIFYVLSGYLMYFQYASKDIGCSIKSNALFSGSKIKKLYPLHIVTMLCAIVLFLAVNIRGGAAI